LLISEEYFDSSSSPKPNYKLDKLEIQFDVKCDVKDLKTKGFSNEKFTIVKQVNGNNRMHEYFLRIIEGVIVELNKNLSAKKLNDEIEHLVKLFSKPKVVSSKTILGLWGELTYMLSCNDIANSIDAWHLDPKNLYDFTFLNKNVEVKTTVKSTRSHNFNNQQLESFKKLEVKIASIITEEATLGKSILDLWNQILNKVNSPDLINKLSRVISKTIRNDVESLSSKKYNFNMALSTLKEIDTKSIPNIQKENIDPSISKVQITVNLDST
jgi:hypothetical protein